jgi:hypothetical protein
LAAKSTRTWALIAIFSVPALAHAWGHAGHQAMALLAEKRLSPATLAWVHGVLGEETIDNAAVWPDVISHLPGQSTRSWHYINLPVGQADAASHWRDYCGPDQCVLSALAHNEKVLQDPATSPQRRRDALCFVIHLIGDLHQPLHCGDNNDRGGNDAVIYVHGRSSSLHQLIDDVVLPHRAARLETVEGYIIKAMDQPGLADQARSGGPEDWQAESFALARDKIYPLYLRRRGDLSRADIRSWQPLVDRQLALATLRLAGTLEKLAPQASGPEKLP